jgi:hypothetical protein
VLDEMAYTFANPTVARHVKSSHEWNGMISSGFGEERDVEIQDAFFDRRGAAGGGAA